MKAKNVDKNPVNTDNIEQQTTGEVIAASPENETIIDDDTVNVDKKELDALIAQNMTMKKELGLMVGLFQHFTGIFSGKNTLSLALQLPKLINDPKITEQVEFVLPIIEKYKHGKQ